MELLLSLRHALTLLLLPHDATSKVPVLVGSSWMLPSRFRQQTDQQTDRSAVGLAGGWRCHRR